MSNSEDELDFDNVSEENLLDVESPISVDEVSSSSNETSSSEEESEQEVEDIHAWGGRKSNYYGGMEDDIDAEGLELQETRELEKNQLQSLQADDFDVSSEEEDENELEDAKLNLGFGIMEEEIRKDISDLSEQDLQKLLRKESPELLVMLPDLSSRLKSLSSSIKPWSDSLHQSPPKVEGKELSATGLDFADCKTQVTLNYCMMLLTYMLLKSERRDVRNHPLMPLLVKSRALIDKLNSMESKLEPLLFANQAKKKKQEEKGETEETEQANDVISETPVSALEGKEEEQFARFTSRKRDREEPEEEFKEEEEEEEEMSDDKGDEMGEEDEFYKEMVGRKEEKVKAKEERKKYLERYVNEDFELEEGESRKATQKILKNRGLVPSRPKENRNPRVKKRRRYEKALKRRKGQVAAIRTNEADQYMGEKSGIRSDVTHSRLFR